MKKNEADREKMEGKTAATEKKQQELDQKRARLDQKREELEEHARVFAAREDARAAGAEDEEAAWQARVEAREATLAKRREFVCQVVAEHGSALYHAAPVLRGDAEVALQAVQSDTRALACTTEKLRKDKEAVRDLITEAGLSFQYAGGKGKRKLTNNREPAELAVSQGPEEAMQLKLAGAKVRKSADVVLAAVTQCGMALKFG